MNTSHPRPPPRMNRPFHSGVAVLLTHAACLLASVSWAVSLRG